MAGKIVYYLFMGENIEFSETLKYIIIDLGINQSQLAQKIGVKPSQISEWLKGKSKPGYDNLKKFCLALDIPSDRLLGLEL